MKKLIEIIDTSNEPNTLQTMQWGGKRKGAGRKSPFKEKTKGVKFMCPVSKVGDLKKYVNLQLLKWSRTVE